MKVIDLFSGCGGFSKGFQMAGYQIVAAVDNDKWACETYKRNFPDTTVINDDVENVYDKLPQADVIIGGVPCQPFSLINRRKKPDDKRASLYKTFLDIVGIIRPAYFVIENVRQFGRLVVDIMNIASKYGYNTEVFDLDALSFGVPQRRVRLFIIGYRGKERSIQDNIKMSWSKDEMNVRDAISDLPPLQPGEGTDGCVPYPTPPLSIYQNIMRIGSGGVYNHSARKYSEINIERFKFYIDCCRMGFQATLLHLLKYKPQLAKTHKHVDKFLDRFKVQWWSEPSSTIIAHIAKDGYHYIHPDVKQCRTFTVREAARCQSFPDTFIFCGSRTEQYKQVGNAVPPLMASAIAAAIRMDAK